jgi:mutator protein MutT
LPRRPDLSDLDRTSVHVVAGVIVDAADRVLLAQRPTGKHLAGGWEFPGGKLGDGEHRLDGLKRELAEELGIAVRAARPLMCIRHAYQDRNILLDVWCVTDYDGEPQGLDRQALRWQARTALRRADVLPADAPIITALRLPPTLSAVGNDNVYQIDAGDLVPKLRKESKLYGVLCADGVEVKRAAEVGADFVAMNSLLDAESLSAVCRQVNVPVFAFGVSLDDAWASGAVGVFEARPI